MNRSGIITKWAIYASQLAVNKIVVSVTDYFSIIKRT